MNTTAQVAARPKANFNRMLALLQLLASGCSAPFRTPLVPINLVAVCTRVVQFFADVQERVVVSLLCQLMSELPHLYQGRNVLFPVGAIDGYRPAILTFASGSQEKRRTLGKRNGGLINGQPSGVNGGSPLHVVKR